MAVILLVRHGENDYVKQNKLAGWTPGVHLNETGRSQAQSLVDRLAQVKIDAIYSSPLERAVETAEPLARASNLPIVLRQRLGEVHYGDWNGASLEVLSKTEAWRGVQFYPSGTRFPGAGETLYEAQGRAVGEIERIAQEHPQGTVVVVSHSDIIKAVLAHYLGTHLDLFQRLIISPASVSVIALGRFGPHILRMNDDGPMKSPEPEAKAPAASPEKSESEQAAPGEQTGAAAPAGEK